MKRGTEDPEISVGDLVVVVWLDASELRAQMDEHAEPEVYVKDWGVFLGVTGTKKKFVVLGKDVVSAYNEWGAVRIPVELIVGTTLLLPRDEVLETIEEIKAVTRKVRMRRYSRWRV